MAKKDQKKRFTKADRQALVWQFTVGGYSCRQTVEALAKLGHKVSHETVAKDRRDVLAELQKETRQAAEQERNLALERLKDLLRIHWPMARQSLKATDAYLKIQDRFAKLYGFEPPDKLALTDPSGQREALLRNASPEELLEALAAIRAARQGGVSS